MKRSYYLSLFFVSLVAFICSSCLSSKKIEHDLRGKLFEVASSDRQWTGIAVSQEKRIFVNFPRWSDTVPITVAELEPSGKLIPYPDEEWNDWTESKSAADHFVCVQSVFIDKNNNLWILDPANPLFAGVIQGGPKLLKVDLTTNDIVQKIVFDESIAPEGSYLNDVRIDTIHNFAYITDSGLGALVIVDLSSGKSRRVLEGHLSTRTEYITLSFKGQEWLLPDGSKPKVQADGIALDPSERLLYYHALTATGLFRIETNWLRMPDLSEDELSEKVEFIGETGATDGMIFDSKGRLYYTALEDYGLKRLNSNQELEDVIRDDRLIWPDSLAFGPDGFLYLTTSQIQLMGDVTEPYKIFKFKPF